MNKADRIRIAIAVSLLSVFILWIAFRLCQLHLGNYAGRIESRNFEQELVAMRGTIYDRNDRENPLAISLPGRLVFIDPQSVSEKHDKLDIAVKVSQALDMDIDQILISLNRTDSRFIRLTVSTDDDLFALLADKTSISGIGVQPRTIRKYPQGSRMAHIIGFINAEGIGSAGIEQHYHSNLAGIPGMIAGEVDAHRKELFRLRKKNIPAVNGADVFLTLDNNIQFIVERELRAALEKSNGDAAWAIVQRVETGEILAMASLPDFDANHYNEVSALVRRNSAIGVNYEPGSTMKSMTIAAALNERIITPRTIVDAESGVWVYGGRLLNDHVRGQVDVATVIKKSSNIGAAKIGLMLGNPRMQAYLRAFGFGEKLGIDLPGEERGILAPHQRWSMVTPTRIAIGHGLAVTALQMVNAYATIANGGYLLQPYVVKRVVSCTGAGLYEAPQRRVIGRPLRPEIAAVMREMLTGVTEVGGTALRAAVEDYTVAGKTGTAQMPVPGGYSQTDYWASFAGFCPASKPEFAVLVVIQRPKPLHTGGVVAAPVFSRISQEVAHYLEIPSDNTPVADGGRP